MKTIDKPNGNEETKQAQSSTYSITVDDEIRPNLLTINIPIGKVIADDSKGFVFLLGFLEHVKIETIAIVLNKKKEIQASKLLTPQQNRIMNAEIKVH